jgi:hypothetical protein
MSSKNTPTPCVPKTIHASLLERLQAGQTSADAAWAAKMSATFRESAAAIGSAIRAIELRAAEICTAEDAMRLRAELSELLRDASAAVRPHTS